MADTLKTMPIASLTDVSPDKDDKLVGYRDSDKDAHVFTVGELQDELNDNISDAFSTSKSYEVGDYCIYNNTLYKCTTAHDKASWNSSHFEAVTVGDELSELNTNIQYGQVTLPTSGVGHSSPYTDTVEFDKQFSEPPIVIVGYSRDNAPSSTYIGESATFASNITEKGFTIGIANHSDGINILGYLTWLAVCI